MVNGFSGKVPSYHLFEAGELDQFPSRRSLSRLGQLVGVRYVVANRGFYGKRRMKEIRHAAEQSSGELRLLRRDHVGDCLLEIAPTIYLADLREPALYIHPDREHSRRVRFEIRADRWGAQSSIPADARIVLLAGSGDLEAPPREVAITPTWEWQPVTVDLPPARESTTPAKIVVRVESKGAEPSILIRSVEVLDEASHNASAHEAVS